MLAFCGRWTPLLVTERPDAVLAMACELELATGGREASPFGSRVDVEAREGALDGSTVAGCVDDVEVGFDFFTANLSLELPEIDLDRE